MDYKSEFWHRLSSNFSAQELAKFRRQFDELDISRDESIDAVELDALLSSFGHNPSPDEIQEMIQAIDLDKSGTIEFDEFLHMIWAIRSGQGGGSSQPSLRRSAASRPIRRWRTPTRTRTTRSLRAWPSRSTPGSRRPSR